MTEYAGKPFYTAHGNSPIMGHAGTLFSYTVYVQKGLKIRPEEVARRVDRTLGDERGWIRGGKVRFQRIESGGATACIVAAPEQVDTLCYPLQTEGYVSCSLGARVVFNSERWLKAVPHWEGSIRTYRQALINHEFGHRIGQGHRSCPGPGERHPVMMQFTYGLQGCRCCNSWPLDSEL